MTETTLKPTEFRLYNYVLVNGCVTRILGIGAPVNEPLIYFFDQKNYKIEHCEGRWKIEGVLITDAILNLCGFELTDAHAGIWKAVGLMIERCVNEEEGFLPLEIINGEYAYFGNAIKYLHQLQNLYFDLNFEELKMP